MSELTKRLDAQAAMTPDEGWRVVGVDDYEDPGEELYAVSDHDTRPEAEAALKKAQARSPDEKMHIYGSRDKTRGKAQAGAVKGGSDMDAIDKLGAMGAKPGQQQPGAKPGQQPGAKPGQQQPGQKPGAMGAKPGQQPPGAMGAKPGQQPPGAMGQQPDAATQYATKITNPDTGESTYEYLTDDQRDPQARFVVDQETPEGAHWELPHESDTYDAFKQWKSARKQGLSGTQIPRSLVEGALDHAAKHHFDGGPHKAAYDDYQAHQGTDSTPTAPPSHSSQRQYGQGAGHPSMNGGAAPSDAIDKLGAMGAKPGQQQPGAKPGQQPGAKPGAMMADKPGAMMSGKPGQQPPKKQFGKSDADAIDALRDLSKAAGDMRAGHKYKTRTADGKGGWVYDYGDTEYKIAAERDDARRRNPPQSEKALQQVAARKRALNAARRKADSDAADIRSQTEAADRYAARKAADDAEYDRLWAEMQAKEAAESSAPAAEAEHDPVAYNKDLAKKLGGGLKKLAGVESASQNYKGTGGQSHRRQLWVRFKDGSRPVDLWLEKDHVEIGGVLHGGNAHGKKVPTTGKSPDEVVRAVSELLNGRNGTTQKSFDAIDALRDLSKSAGDMRAGHKYKTRTADGKGGWVYTYADSAADASELANHPVPADQQSATRKPATPQVPALSGMTPLGVRPASQHTPHELLAMHHLLSYTPAARKTEFLRNGLGEYHAGNPHVKALIDKGLVKVQGKALVPDKEAIIRVTKQHSTPKEFPYLEGASYVFKNSYDTAKSDTAMDMRMNVREEPDARRPMTLRETPLIKFYDGESPRIRPALGLRDFTLGQYADVPVHATWNPACAIHGDHMHKSQFDVHAKCMCGK